MAITAQAQIDVLKAALQAMISGGSWPDFMSVTCEACLEPLVYDPCPNPDPTKTLPVFYVEPCANPTCPSNLPSTGV